MKQEYQHLKLIIETPTQDAWDKVTKFFGLEWGKWSEWGIHGDQTNIDLTNGKNGFGTLPIGYSEPRFNSHDRLIYPEFVNRFLEPKAVTLEQVKDEYASGFGYEGWSELRVSGQHLNDKSVTEIATRYASVMVEETKAQHDEEMKEFLAWAIFNIDFKQNKRNLDEVLQLFRNRNK